MSWVLLYLFYGDGDSASLESFHMKMRSAKTEPATEDTDVGACTIFRCLYRKIWAKRHILGYFTEGTSYKSPKMGTGGCIVPTEAGLSFNKFLGEQAHET